MKLTCGLFASALLAITLGACKSNLPFAPNGAEPATLDRVSAVKSHPHSQARVFTAAGDITKGVDAFRGALGTLNANLPGSQRGGRREINWDAVPAAFTNTNDFPVDFFNQPVAGRARGTVFSTPGTGFRTSDNNFSDVNQDDGRFVFFSPVRTFAPVGSSRMTVDFFVPGSDVAATSTGFGVVFSDVDRRGSASIRLFDTRGRSLGKFMAPAAPGGLSFVGVTFPSAVVARVEIRSGKSAVVSIGGKHDPRNTIDGGGRDDGDDDDDKHSRRKGPDLVIMDDFIYGEPIAPSAGSSGAVATTDGGIQPTAR